MRVAAAVLALLVPLSAHADCITQDQADAKVADIKKANEASFATALATKKLAPVLLHEKTWRKSDPKPAGLVEISDREVNCEHTRPEFVQGADKKVYALARGPHPTKTTLISVCTCEVIRFSCGGANLGRENVGYALPAGMTYGGEMSIPFDMNNVRVTYKTSDCPRPQPPP